MRATYRVVQALAAPGQITYGVNWTVSPDHPLADGQTLLELLEAAGTAIPWTRAALRQPPTRRRRSGTSGRR